MSRGCGERPEPKTLPATSYACTGPAAIAYIPLGELGPNPSFNRTCLGVAAPGVISFSPGFATLAHAG
jgi:hypothetical protein